MRPLTLTTPKPLVSIGGRTLLDHIVSVFPDEIGEIILVVRYLADQIKAYCGTDFHGRKVTYAEGSALGSAYSFLAAAPFIRDERFLFANGDEFPDPEDIKACLRQRASVLCWEAPDPENHGVATLNPDGTIAYITEKPKRPEGNLITNGIMVLPRSICGLEPRRNANGEYFFTSLVDQLARREPVMAVRSRRAIGGISTMNDVERLNGQFRPPSILSL